MNAQELRDLQAPLKARYRNAPDSAVITLKATGTLGVDREAPVGFREIRLRFDIDSPAGADQIATLMQLTERYCVVFQTLHKGPRLAVSHHLTGR